MNRDDEMMDHLPDHGIEVRERTCLPEPRPVHGGIRDARQFDGMHRPIALPLRISGQMAKMPRKQKPKP
jgi:hypothetical protein